MIVVLAGGVGAAKFLEGLICIKPQEQIFIIGNTGDDRDFYGLHVSPDLDIIVYTLAKVVNPQQGWGIKQDTYATMNQLTFLGYDSWFLLGDKDLATHIYRTHLLKQGKTLSEATREIVKKFGLQIQLVPMSNDIAQTYIKTPQGIIHFEEYFVKYRTEIPVLDIIFPHSAQAKAAPEILEAIATAEAIIIAPSNPLVSIGSILAIPGIKQALLQTKSKKIAISPIISGKPIKGPADKLMKFKHLEVSAFGVAQYYKDFLNGMIIDLQDAYLQSAIEKLGMEVFTLDTIMHDIHTKKKLAAMALTAAGVSL